MATPNSTIAAVLNWMKLNPNSVAVGTVISVTVKIVSPMFQRLLALMLQGLAPFTEGRRLFSRHLCVYFTALSIKGRE